MVVGGTSSNERNIISGNGLHGVLILSTPTNVTMKGNLIGTNAAQTAALPNGTGITLSHSTGTVTIGGTTMDEQNQPNVVSGNTTNGIHVTGTATTVIQGNVVGGNASLSTAISNGVNGILVEAAAQATTTVGVESHTFGQWNGRNMVTGTSSGALLSPNPYPNPSAPPATLENCVDPNPTVVALCGADPHAMCLDGTRLEVYGPGVYRYFSDDKGTVANIEVRHDKRGRDYAHAFWMRWIDPDTGAVEEETHSFVGKVFDSKVNHDNCVRVDRTIEVGQDRMQLTFILEGEYNTAGMRVASSGMVLRCNGMMAAQLVKVQSLTSIEDVGDMIAVSLFESASRKSALVCGSKNPHMVSFFGALVPSPPDGELHTILKLSSYSGNAYEVIALFLNSHIHSFVVQKNGAPALAATFDVDNEVVQHAKFDKDGNALPAERTAGATGILSEVISPLFIRSQSCGAVSFSLEPENVSQLQGKLAAALSAAAEEEQNENHQKKPSGLYANMLEPHLMI